MGEGTSGFEKGTDSVGSFGGLGRGVLTEAAGFRGGEAVAALSRVRTGWSGKVAARGALRLVVWKGNEWREGASGKARPGEGMRSTRSGGVGRRSCGARLFGRGHLVSSSQRQRMKQKHIQERRLSGPSDPSILAGSESTGRT